MSAHPTESRPTADARRSLVLGILGLVLGMAAVWSPAFVATARAAEIPGNPLHIFADGSGRLQARLDGFAAGELRPAHLDLADQRSGMVFTIHRAGGGSSILCGPSVVASTPTEVSPPTVTGAGTSAAPYELRTSYICDPSVDPLEITQTFRYVNGDSHFVASYAVTNPGSAPVRFSAVCRGVFTAAGSGQGQGFFDASPPRIVGVFNDAQGSEGGLIEAASTPWARYEEAAVPVGLPFGDFYEPGESALWGELSNTVDPSLVTDPRAAAQFDRRASFGLPAGETDTYDVIWYFGRYDGLSLSPASGSAPVGQTRSVTATSLNHGAPVAAGTIRYAVTGANPASGAIGTDASGAATITLSGQAPGQDTLTAYIDSDGNGAFDPAIDTQQTASFAWTAIAAPPPPPPPPPPLPPAAPSSRFAIVSVKATSAGLVRLVLDAPAAGAYRAVGTFIRKQRTNRYGTGRASVLRAGRVTLTIRPTLAAKARLRRAAIKVKIAVTFTPKGGTPRTKHARASVKRRVATAQPNAKRPGR